MKITAINTSNNVNYKAKKNSNKNLIANSYVEPKHDKKEFEIQRLRAMVLGLIAVGSAVASSVVWFILTRGKTNKKK